MNLSASIRDCLLNDPTASHDDIVKVLRKSGFKQTPEQLKRNIYNQKSYMKTSGILPTVKKLQVADAEKPISQEVTYKTALQEVYKLVKSLGMETVQGCLEDLKSLQF